MALTLDFSRCMTEKDVKKVFDGSKEELDALKHLKKIR